MCLASGDMSSAKLFVSIGVPIVSKVTSIMAAARGQHDASTMPGAMVGSGCTLVGAPKGGGHNVWVAKAHCMWEWCCSPAAKGTKTNDLPTQGSAG